MLGEQRRAALRSFPCDPFKETFLVELPQNVSVDEVLGFLVLYPGDANRDFVHGIAHALHVGIAALIRGLDKALVRRFENFGISGFQIFGNYFLGLLFVG